ncbi:MAG: YfhO family protein [bacterium]
MRDNDSTVSGALWPGILLLVLSFICLFPAAVFKGHAIIPAEILYRYHPWQQEYPETQLDPVNWILFDEILEFYPWRELARTSIRQGRIPLWDPTAFCGYPFAGLYQNALMYPIDRLLDVFTIRFYTVLRAFLHILVAGIGMGLYLRHHRLTTSAITLGITAFGLSGFMIVWLGHPHARVAAWLPMLFLSMDLLHHKTIRAVPLVSLAITMSLFAGHIQTSLHTVSAAVLYFFAGFTLRKHQNRRFFETTGALAIAILTSILIAGAMLMPFAEYLSRSVAYATRARGVVIQGWLNPEFALTLLMPKLFGSSADDTYWHPDFNSSEIGGLFIGITVVVLALAAVLILQKRTIVKIHACIASITVLTVFGVRPIYSIVSSLPGFIMAYNFRLALVTSFSMITLAAFMLNALVNNRDIDGRRAIRWISILLIIAVLVGVHFLPRPSSYQADADPSRSIWIAVTTLALLFIASLNSSLRYQFLSIFAFILLPAVELLYFGAGFNPTSPPERLDARPKSASIVQVDPTQNPFRTLPIGHTYPPHLASLLNMHDIRGNDAMTPLLTEEYVSLFSPDILTREYTLPALRMMWLNKWSSPLVDALNVKYVLLPTTDWDTAPGDLVPYRTSGGVHVFLNPRYLERAFLVHNWKTLENDDDVKKALLQPDVDLSLICYTTDMLPFSAPTAPVDATEDSVRFTTYGAHRISLETFSRSEALLALSDTFYPGWTVLVNDQIKTCYRVNHMMRGVFVEPGHNRIEFRYEPLSWRLGLFLTCIGCCFYVFVFSLFCANLSRKNCL